MRGASLLAAALVLAAPFVAQGDDESWGEAKLGLRLRAVMAPVPERGNPLLAAVKIELRNERETAVPHAELPTGATLITKARYARLPDGIKLLPIVHPLRDRERSIPAGGTLTWTRHVWRASKAAKKAPVDLGVLARLQLRDEEKNLRNLRSQPFTLDLSDRPVARKLTAQDLVTWSSATVLAYSESRVWGGSEKLVVWPSGRAQVMRRAPSMLSRDKPPFELEPGHYEAQLTAEDLESLVKALRDHQIWRLGELQEQIVGLEGMHMSLIAGTGAMRASFTVEFAQSRHSGYRAVRRELQRLMQRVAALAKD